MPSWQDCDRGGGDETIEVKAVERGKKAGGKKMRREIQRVMENEREADGGGWGGVGGGAA